MSFGAMSAVTPLSMRFTSALISRQSSRDSSGLEDRGFEVLEVGYDICTKQENKKKAVDEHYDVIWLSYVVGRKK